MTHLHTSESGKIGIQLTPIDEIFKTHTINYNIFQAIPRGIEIGVDKLTSYVSQMKYVFTKEGAETLADSEPSAICFLQSGAGITSGLSRLLSPWRLRL